MPNTPVQALPYPALTDPANGPLAIQNLATALENGKTIVTCTSATRPAHLEGRVIYETDTDRILVSDGANWQLFTSRKSPRGYVATVYDAGPWAPGTFQVAAMGTSLANPATDLRTFQVTAQWIGKANAGAGTGHTVTLVRSVDGGATWAGTADNYYAVYPSTTIESSCAVAWLDNPTAGNVRYRLQFAAYGINGDIAANVRLNVYDVGGQ